MTRADEVSPLLGVACYRVLRRFGRDGQLSGAVFNKVMTLLNRRLLQERPEQRLDLGLPHCWYLFGDEVVPRELPGLVLFDPPDAEVHRAIFRIDPRAPVPEYPSGWQLSRLGEELSTIEDEFGNPVDLTEIVDEVYDGAPFPFQKPFLDLRRRLRFRNELWQLEDPVEGMVRPLFDEAMSSFPAPDFPELKSLTTKYRRIGGFALDLGRPALESFDRITGEYWQTFCYLLRIHDRGHFHVSESRLGHWSRVAHDYLASAGPRMSTLASELVETFAGSIDPLDRAALVGTEWAPSASSERSGGVDSLAYN
jgi:hypothetical protein